MSSRGPLEGDTCRDYVLPRLKAAGWTDDQIIEQYPITDGRIMTVGQRHRRDKPLRADYVLEYRPGVPVAVVEAKREHSIPAKGMQQARRYGQLLDLPLAYATNGKGIVEDDRDTGRERDQLNTCRRSRAPVQPGSTHLRRQREGAALLPADRDQPHRPGGPGRRQAAVADDGHGHRQDLRLASDHLETLDQPLVR